MIDKGKYNILGVLVNAIDYEEAVSRIIHSAKERQGLSVSALAVHGIMTGVLDNVHRFRLNHIDLICPDGQPVRWTLNLLYKAGLSDRVYGPNLTLRVCEQAAKKGLSIYLYGSHQEVLDALTQNLVRRYPQLQIVGTQPSRFRQIDTAEKQIIVQQIRKSQANIVLVGLGCPRQEVWVYEYKEALSIPVLAVGAAFDFHAGRLPQAPPALQALGLEWLYRLIQEPKRLWQRYIVLNPYYLWLLSLQILGVRQFDPHSAQAPTQELGYG
ncbi:MAG: WecB/TagA/CpsF family glycosyltransferase [Prochlorotrichaceae cyanobacterium]